MSEISEPVYNGEFLVSEGNGRISRDVITVASGSGVLTAGTVLGKITASGKFAAYNGAAADGSETAVAVLFETVDATSADVSALAIVRLAEVNASELIGLDVAGIADLTAATIIVR